MLLVHGLHLEGMNLEHGHLASVEGFDLAARRSYQLAAAAHIFERPVLPDALEGGGYLGVELGARLQRSNAHRFGARIDAEVIHQYPLEFDLSEILAFSVFPFIIASLGGLARNLAKVEVASSSLVSRSK